MAIRTDEFLLKRGEVGAVMTATLKDANGAVDLTGGSVAFTATNAAGVDTIDHAACTLVTPASGIVSYAFDVTTANIPATRDSKGRLIGDSDYRTEFKFTDASGAVHFFPKLKDGSRTYCSLIVQESL